MGAAIEGFSYRHTQFDRIAAVGLAIYLFSAIALLFVMRTLGPFWSGKVLIAPHHELVVHPVFRAIKHPNYFLNMIPELVGFTIIFHAWLTLIVGLPVFLITLFFRIRIEEQVLKNKFAAYWSPAARRLIPPTALRFDSFSISRPRSIAIIPPIVSCGRHARVCARVGASTRVDYAQFENFNALAHLPRSKSTICNQFATLRSFCCYGAVTDSRRLFSPNN